MNGLSRNQWREIHRTINKGGLPALKQVAQDIYTQGHEDGCKAAFTSGLAEIKQVVLNAVEQTLHQEFGFGQKRYDKFVDKFSEIVEKQVFEVNTKIAEENVEDARKIYTLSDLEQTAYIILLCMKEYVYNTSDLTDSDFFKEPEINQALKNVHAAMDYFVGVSTTKVTKREVDAIYDVAKKKALYLTDTNK